MIPGQHYNHDPRHFKFERQLQDHRGLDFKSSNFGDRLVYAVCITIITLATIALFIGA